MVPLFANPFHNIFLFLWTVFLLFMDGINCVSGMLWMAYSKNQFSLVQLLSRVQLFVTPWTHQASLSLTSPQSLLKLMYIASVMPSNHLILCRPLLLPPSIFPSIRVFFKWVSSLHQVAKSIGVSASASPLPVNIQDWSPLGLTGWISLQSKGLSRVFSNTTVQKPQFFSAKLCLWSSSHISHISLEVQCSLIPSSSLSWNSTFYFYFSLKVSASKWKF